MKTTLSRFFLLWAILNCTTFSYAQSITLTAPTANIAVSEGDDFATEVLGDPWDMDERRDLGWEENFEGLSVTAQNGIWSGVNSAPGGYIFPLYPGFIECTVTQGLPGDQTLPNFGITHRIDSSKYTMLSYHLNHSSRSSYAVYWESSDTKNMYWPTSTSPYVARFDGFYHSGSAFSNSGWTVYSLDLSNKKSFEMSQGEWRDRPYALRIDPSIVGATGALTELDWVRLVDPDSAPELNISWSLQGITTNSVVTVWVDSNNSGYDGSPVARFSSKTGPTNYLLPTAILPPGEYFFYVTAQANSGSTLIGTEYRSDYSAKLTINHRPTGYFTAPTQITGEDYASTVLNNPWNMDTADDLINLNPTWPHILRQFSNYSFADNPTAEEEGRLFFAQADPPLYSIGNNESDVQLHLNVSSTQPIDASKYRYLTYRLLIDPTYFPSLQDRIRRGWVSRPIWWSDNLMTNGGRPKAHILYEGWHTYTIDLWDPNLIEAGYPWLNFSQIKSLRLDPLETDVYTWFFLDWVKLTADNYTENKSYQLSFVVQDADSDTVDIELYYDTNNSGFDGTKITTLSNKSAGTHSYNWDTGNLSAGSQYYIYMMISDGKNQTGVYAPVPIVIDGSAPPPEPRTNKAELDYDGDGISDQVVYRPSTGVYYQNKSVLGATALPWGNYLFKPVHGDFDGDGITDTGLYTTYLGYYFWFIIRSSDRQLYHRVWGLANDEIIIGDYNGNGRDELAVYRSGAWFILDENDHITATWWGQPGDVPVPRDYDGDNKADIAIWRPTDGMWWILHSSYATGGTSEFYAAIQWGLPGDIPVPADWTGDGRDDLAVFRPEFGMWYLRDIETGEYTATQWGLPGDIPIVGDFNGDGSLDLTVYREAGGLWYHNFRNAETSVVQFGLPGDLIPEKAQ